MGGRSVHHAEHREPRWACGCDGDGDGAKDETDDERSTERDDAEHEAQREDDEEDQSGDDGLDGDERDGDAVVVVRTPVPREVEVVAHGAVDDAHGACDEGGGDDDAVAEGERDGHAGEEEGVMGALSRCCQPWRASQRQHCCSWRCRCRCRCRC